MSAKADTIESAVNQSEWPQEFRPSKKLALLALVILSAIFAISMLFDAQGGDYFTICGFKNLTGLPCPGCGLTHSFCAIGKGRLGEAFSYNLLGLPLFLVFVFVWARSALVLLNRKGPVFVFDQMLERIRLIKGFAIAFIAFGLARIVYALLFQPEHLRASPLVNWLSSLFN
jgi:uncharacterized protein DUF2752